jgi:hypothetical protein
LTLALLILLVLAATLSSGRADVVIYMSLILVFLLASVRALVGVVKDAEPGERTAATVALVAAAGVGLGFAMTIGTPPDQGANIGAGIIVTISLPTLVISSLLAWLQVRAAHGPNKRNKASS